MARDAPFVLGGGLKIVYDLLHLLPLPPRAAAPAATRGDALVRTPGRARGIVRLAASLGLPADPAEHADGYAARGKPAESVLRQWQR